MAETRDERGDAILDAALELAASGGFDHVRQRDVAARANVALGTLYKRFRSKEDLLAAAMAREVERLAKKLEKQPAKGATTPARVGACFAIATQHLCRRPRVAHAMIRAMASGVPEIAAKVTGYQGRMAGLVIAAMRSERPGEREMTYTFMLLQLWFSCLVGWSAGLFAQSSIDDQMARAAHVLAKGLDVV